MRAVRGGSAQSRHAKSALRKVCTVMALISRTLSISIHVWDVYYSWLKWGNSGWRIICIEPSSFCNESTVAYPNILQCIHQQVERSPYKESQTLDYRRGRENSCSCPTRDIKSGNIYRTFHALQVGTQQSRGLPYMRQILKKGVQ